MMINVLRLLMLASPVHALRLDVGVPDLQRSPGLGMRQKDSEKFAQYATDKAWLTRYFSGSHAYDITLPPAESYKKYTATLNKVLLREKGLQTKPCNEFSINDLLDLQQTLLKKRSAYLDEMYQERNSVLSLKNVLGSGSAVDIEHRRQSYSMLQSGSASAILERDNACHHANTLFAHHLSVPTREELKSQITLPLLPTEPAPGVERMVAKIHSLIRGTSPVALSQQKSKDDDDDDDDDEPVTFECRGAKVYYAYACACPYNLCCDYDHDGTIDVDAMTPPPFVTDLGWDKASGYDGATYKDPTPK